MTAHSRAVGIDPAALADRCAGRSGKTGSLAQRPAIYAAFSHIAVSKALLINGMFMPKLLLAAFFAAGLAGFAATLAGTSVARSHDPRSWERATEKNRST